MNQTPEDDEVIGGRCDQCGTLCEPLEQICLHCACANARTEEAVNELREELREDYY